MGFPFLRWTALVVVILVAIPGFVSVTPTPSRPAGPSLSIAPAPNPSLTPSENQSALSQVVAPAYRPAASISVIGPLPAATPLDLVVGLRPSDPSGLTAYVVGANVPGSSTYRVDLTPSEVAQRYGPAPATVERVRQYFSGYGLSSTAPPGGFLLEVQGPSAAIARAFGTTFLEYRDPSGRLFVSHPSMATLPGGLGVTGVYGLGDVNPFRPLATSAGSVLLGPTPAAACGPSPNSALSPCQVQTAYSSYSLILNGTRGQGVRIGIVDAYGGAEPQSLLASDLSLFASQFGLSSGNVSYAYPVPTSLTDLNNSSTNPAWGLEEALDLEWARASAPDASIVMAFSPDAGPGLFYAIGWLVATHAVDIISMSWTEPLTGVFNAYAQPCDFACNASTDGSYTLLDPIFEAAAAEGISLFAASGDCGAGGGTSGFAVSYPAADPFVTGVGGTNLHVYSNGTYLGETGWNGSASGTAAPGCTNQGGSGGGFSNLPRPAWQGGVPNASGGRAVPDVSLDAETSAAVMYRGSLVGVTGTSLGSPIWAGITAITDQYAGRALGFLNPGLYRIYQSSNYSADFHDILSGNNGYPAGPGWDPVTGIGTPIVSGLVRDLSGSLALPLHRPTTFLYASPRYGPVPLAVSFVVNASGGTGSYPVLGVNFGDGNSSLSGTPAHHEYLTPGVYAAQAFAIDAGGNASASPPIAIVVGGGRALSVSISASTVAPATDAPITFAVNASGGIGPYQFDVFFGDGTYVVNQTGPTLVHAFHAAGSYCAEALAWDAASPVDGAASLRLGIAVGGAPAPACGNDSTPLTLTPNPTSQVRDAPADFPSLFTSSGGAPSPPGLSSSVQYEANDPYVRACQCTIFRSAGTYSVRAWENDTVDQEAFAQTNVTVMPPLVGAFRASTLSGPAPLTVRFSVAVTGGDGADPATTQWNFSEGAQSIGANVTHTFGTPGEYLVIGRLTDAGHGNTSEAFLLDVEGPGSTGAYGLTGTVSPAIAILSGATVHFTGAIVAPPGSTGLDLRWILGPGRAALGAEVNETYYAPLPPPPGGPGASAPNTLAVSLSLVNVSSVAVATADFNLSSFFATEAAGFVPRASALSFSASLSPQYGPSPLTTFGTATIEGPGTAAVGWYFGDGANATGPSVNHTYASGGAFAARAEGNDSFGDMAVASYAVLVGVPLTVSGGPSVTSGTAPLTVTFTATAFGGYGPPYTYSWTFGGGSPANGSVVNRTFSSVGTYTATVHVRDAQGLLLNRSWTVTVEGPGGIPAVALVAGGAAVGVGIGLIALWIARRSRRAPPVGPPPTL